MDTQDRAGSSMNDSGTGKEIDTPLTQPCSAFDLEDTPESLGAMAALSAKAQRQDATHFFYDPIDVRRALIARREAAGADTPHGHTCSNIIEILENLYGYERPAWASDERQTLPWMMNHQIKRLESLTARPKMLTYQPAAE